MQFRLATYGIDLGLALFLLLSSALFVLAASLSELGFLLFALATTDFLLLLELSELLKHSFSNINLISEFQTCSICSFSSTRRCS